MIGREAMTYDEADPLYPVIWDRMGYTLPECPWSYEHSVKTWRDERPVPSDEECRRFWEGFVRSTQFQFLKQQKSDDLLLAFAAALADGWSPSAGITLDAEMDRISAYRNLEELALRRGDEIVTFSGGGKITTLPRAEFSDYLVGLGNHHYKLQQRLWERLQRTNAATTAADLESIEW